MNAKDMTREQRIIFDKIVNFYVKEKGISEDDMIMVCSVLIQNLSSHKKRFFL